MDRHDEETDWDQGRFESELANATARLIEMGAPANRTVSRIREVIAHFPARQRTVAFNCFQVGYDSTAIQLHALDLEHERSVGEMSANNQREARDHGRELRAFWAGLVLLIAAVGISVLAHTSDPSARLGLRVMAGLGAGLIIAYLPGFFRLDAAINRKPWRITIAATGAFAAFVMIYLFDPGWISAMTLIGK